MSLIIYFLRHGETTASQIGGYCGTLDPDLTPEGYQMAEDFADSYNSMIKFFPLAVLASLIFKALYVWDLMQ